MGLSQARRAVTPSCLSDLVALPNMYPISTSPRVSIVKRFARTDGWDLLQNRVPTTTNCHSKRGGGPSDSKTSRTGRLFVIPLLCATQACRGDDPAAPDRRSLAVTITGLPASQQAAVTVTGPAPHHSR